MEVVRTYLEVAQPPPSNSEVPANLPTLPTHPTYPTHPINSILTTPPTEQASARQVQAKLVELPERGRPATKEKAITAKKIAEKTKFFNALVEANDNNDKAEETIAELTVSKNTLANGKANVEILNRRLRDSVEALREKVYDLEEQSQALKSLEESEEKVRLLLIAGQSITTSVILSRTRLTKQSLEFRQLEIEASQVSGLIAQNSELATKNEQLHALIRGAESNFEVAVQDAAANLVASNSGEAVCPSRRL
ncbi:hypothetical protein DID88_010089 [Monilinia fructigena]|uniref:Uncharacterized protein n=1 Tax=Monilinia fructigena TaxID=38457 RepID=A0A395INL6_9HELO|nr:hypothetical protein DID88_010089 [Monilinia fructigena]